MNDHLAHSLYSLLARSVDICVVVDGFCWVDPSASPCTAPGVLKAGEPRQRDLESNGVVVIISCKQKKQCAMYYNILVRYKPI